MASEWLGFAEDLTMGGVVGNSAPGGVRSLGPMVATPGFMFGAAIIGCVWMFFGNNQNNQRQSDRVADVMATEAAGQVSISSEPAAQADSAVAAEPEVATAVQPAAAAAARRLERPSHNKTPVAGGVGASGAAPDSVARAADIDLSHYRELAEKL